MPARESDVAAKRTIVVGNSFIFVGFPSYVRVGEFVVGMLSLNDLVGLTMIEDQKNLKAKALRNLGVGRRNLSKC